MTRAVPVFEPPYLICRSCDGDECGNAGDDNTGLRIYWECRNCIEDLADPISYYLCDECNSKSKHMRPRWARHA